MSTELVRICVIGPESTGKTTLAQRLAEWAETEWVPEGSREYAERTPRPLTAEDVGPIAREHIRLADAASARVRARGRGLLVLDTDLVSTVVYGRHYYGTVPAWVERAERLRRASLYLLSDVDVPWVPDGIRDRPTDREAMHALFASALARRHANVVHVSGGWDERWKSALDAVRARVER